MYYELQWDERVEHAKYEYKIMTDLKHPSVVEVLGYHEYVCILKNK